MFDQKTSSIIASNFSEEYSKTDLFLIPAKSESVSSSPSFTMFTISLETLLENETSVSAKAKPQARLRATAATTFDLIILYLLLELDKTN